MFRKVFALFAMTMGLATAAAASSFAVVNTDGTLLTGSSDVSGVNYFGTGRYEVTFTSPVANCSYVATTWNIYSQALQAYTAGGHLGPQGVYVETKNQGGGLTDGIFTLAVICDATGTQYAVVGYAADLVRSTPGTVLTPLGFGRYQVTFPSPAGSCAYIATVGDPANALVFNPSGVYTGSGPDNNTVYIETKNPGGGLQDGVPFHLGAVCPNAPNTSVLVVNANGFAQRGSALTSSYQGSTGEYTLVTSGDISACGPIGTRGSVDMSVPFDPATIEITGGPAANTTGYEVRQLLFGGGNVASESFHGAVFCGL
jgi:hypothetical protein